MTHRDPDCRLCGGASKPVFTAAEYCFYRCDACRTAFVSPVPNAAELARFYDMFHRASEEGGSYEGFEPRMQADFPAKVSMVLNAHGNESPGRLLDVGCGKGYFVRACADRGINAEGVDLSESGVRFAREQLGVTAHAGALGELKNTLGTFDVATFWATIEHLPDPVQMLRDIASVLKPGGRLFLDTGIGDDWLDRTLPGRVQWYDPPQHLFVFSAAGLKLALEAAGFRLEHFDPNFERTPLRRILKTARNGAVAAGLRIVSELGNTVPRGTGFVRYPLGNLMCATAIKSGAN